MFRIITHVSILLMGSVSQLKARDLTDTSGMQKYSLHFQATVIPQYHFDFYSPYAGQNSLQPSEPPRSSYTGTGYFACKPFTNTYFVFNPEFAGGKGLSKTLGIAGFPNGEVYRVGDPTPTPFIARLYVEHRFPLSKRMEKVEDDQNQLAETTHKDFISLVFGKFSLTDFFDDSQISHDPRTQLMNWSLMSNGAWDYPANTRGYTIGGMFQVLYYDWAFRTALTTVPIEANGPELQFKYNKAMGMVWELEKTHLFKKDDTHFSTLHMGIFSNLARMGNYAQSLQNAGSNAPDITSTREYGRNKWGYYLSLDNNFGYFHHFIKTSWNDGKNESWAFTEIDQSITTGILLDGNLWKRNKDKFSLGLVSNGLSFDHMFYLKSGGYGFLIGDGKLNYGHEQIIEAYYACHLSKNLTLSPDYQFVMNPGYNKDRGPVNIVALRLHAEF